jgi:hypothetical protein
LLQLFIPAEVIEELGHQEPNLHFAAFDIIPKMDRLPVRLGVAQDCQTRNRPTLPIKRPVVVNKHAFREGFVALALYFNVNQKPDR